jgi:hypothetical protein
VADHVDDGAGEARVAQVVGGDEQLPDEGGRLVRARARRGEPDKRGGREREGRGEDLRSRLRLRR